MHGALGCQLPKKEPFPLQRNLGHLVGMDLKGNFGNFWFALLKDDLLNVRHCISQVLRDDFNIIQKRFGIVIW